MIPLFFSGLLKEAKGILFKGYDLGVLKIEGRAKSEDGVSFNSTAESRQDDGAIFGDLELSYHYTDNIRIYEKWSTNNRIKTELTLINLIAGNMKNVLGFRFFTNSKEDRIAYLNNQFVFDPLTLNLNLDTEGKLHVDATAFVINNLTIGAECKFNYNENEVKNYRVVVRYEVNEDIVLGFRYKKDNLLSGSVFYRALPELKTAFLVRSSLGGEEGGSSGQTTVGVGCKYRLDEASTLRAKLVSTKEFGFSYHHKIQNVSVGLSALFDCSDFQNGNHKAGFGLRIRL